MGSKEKRCEQRLPELTRMQQELFKLHGTVKAESPIRLHRGQRDAASADIEKVLRLEQEEN